MTVKSHCRETRDNIWHTEDHEICFMNARFSKRLYKYTHLNEMQYISRAQQPADETNQDFSDARISEITWSQLITQPQNERNSKTSTDDVHKLLTL